MSTNVYFIPVEPDLEANRVSQLSRQLLETAIEREGVVLTSKVPLKVHFGEPKNVTFIRPENYVGLIEFLKEREIESCYIETCVLYGGQRFKQELHEVTAKEHGFTQLPVVFADGEHGEDFAEIEVDLNHFKTCKIGRAFQDYEQMLVVSHFKGHMLAGFGGAIKQLSMGCASKGGKMAMHLGMKPHIKKRKCTQCEVCKTRCAVDALNISDKSWIDHEKCVGCGACMAVCPHEAITIFSFKAITRFVGIGNPFIEKVVEGAFAAQKGKRNIYINYALSITKGCDCEAKKMKPVMDDMGIFVSTDPVAIDKACYDMAKARGRKFRGAKTFPYAESIGLGSTDYELVELEPV